MSERASSYIFAQNRPDIRYAWRGPSLLITDPTGRCGNIPFSGYFFRETRYLRILRLLIEGQAPFPCSAAEIDHNRLEFTAIFPEGSGGEGYKKGIPNRGLDLRYSYSVRANGLEIEVKLTSRWADVEFNAAWELSADYADLTEAESEKKEQTPVSRSSEANVVRFSCGNSDLSYQTVVTASGAEWHAAQGQMQATVPIRRGDTAVLRLSVDPIDYQDRVNREEWQQREQYLENWFDEVTNVESAADSTFARFTNRALRTVGSFALLEGQEGEWLTPAAGAPLFPTLFGRDAATVAYQMAAFDGGRIATAVLHRLQALQGDTVNDYRDEEPGRILYQARQGPLSRLHKTPHALYYEDYASPFDFIFALGEAYSWAGDKQILERHYATAIRILNWAREFGDKDGDGYLEYLTKNPQGPKHQGWKDSSNAIVYPDGSQVDPPVATCEVQAYYYLALRIVAALSVIMGKPAAGLTFWKAATGLKERFNRDFWVEEEQCIALGLDSRKQQIQTVASNAGCFVTGILNEDRLPTLVRRLFASDMYSGWGIRTLSCRNPAYNPLSYHLGSVWPVENATIILGLRRFGFNNEAVQLSRALYDLALIWKGGQIPECVGGYDRTEMRHPGAYPRANVPQTWNETAFPLILQSLLGLQPVAALHTLAIDPVLPDCLSDVTLCNLHVGGSKATLRFTRNREGHTEHEVIAREGPLHILHQAPIGTLSIGLWDRLGALVKDVLPF